MQFEMRSVKSSKATCAGSAESRKLLLIRPCARLSVTRMFTFMLCICVGFTSGCSAQGGGPGQEQNQVEDASLDALAETKACEVSADFRLARPADSGGEVVEGIRGNYEISSSPSTAGLKFEKDYVSEYAGKIEKAVFGVAQNSLCKDGKSAILQITIVELSFFQPFNLEQVPRYGQISINEKENTVHGVFVWNPRQIVADQYWLHTNQLAPNENEQISQTLFDSSANIYHQYLSTFKSEESSRQLARIPKDLLWLFEVSPQSHRVGFPSLARIGLESLISGSEPGYSALASELIGFELKSPNEALEPTLQDLLNPQLSAIYKYSIAP